MYSEYIKDETDDMDATNDDSAVGEAHLGGDSNTKQRLHRSLPRVRAILDDENYLSGILHAVESSGCASQAVATTTNNWMIAFEMVYSTVATDCHLPQGKNRHHKFKDKIVEVWQAIESEIAEKKQSSAHPLYALGMKQLEIYKTVAKSGGAALGDTPVSEKATKRASTTGEQEMASGAAASSNSAAGSATASQTPQPARKKSRPSVSRQSIETAAAAAMASGSSQLEELFRRGVLRLESLSYQHVPPKLPSPLQEMYRIRLQLQERGDTELLSLLEPYYSDAVASYLTSVTHQANNSAHPAMLPTVMEGLDTLLQGNVDATLSASIRYTYKVVFQSYLKLINPRVAAAQPPTVGTETRGSKRKAKERADSHDDGKKQGGEGKDDDDSHDATAV